MKLNAGFLQRLKPFNNFKTLVSGNVKEVCESFDYKRFFRRLEKQ